MKKPFKILLLISSAVSAALLIWIIIDYSISIYKKLKENVFARLKNLFGNRI